MRSEDLTLEAPDGNELAAFAAIPDEPGPIGVVVLPDVRGLYRFYEELALRFAERGYPAVAFDYFGRTAGVGEARRRVPVHGSRRADDARGHPAGRPGRGRVPPLACGRQLHGDLHGRLLLRRPELLARGRGRARARGCDRLLRLNRSSETARQARRSVPPSSRRRSSRSRRATTRTSSPSTTPPSTPRSRRRRRARARRLRRRSPQLLRPQVRGVRRRVGRRLGTGARVHRAARGRRRLTQRADLVGKPSRTGGSRTSRAAGKRESR